MYFKGPEKTFPRLPSKNLVSLGSHPELKQLQLDLSTSNAHPIPNSLSAYDPSSKIFPHIKTAPTLPNYKATQNVLHTSLPPSLVGREAESKALSDFIKSHISTKTAGSMYMSGAPGTGKTAILRHTIDNLLVSCFRLITLIFNFLMQATETKYTLHYKYIIFKYF